MALTLATDFPNLSPLSSELKKMGLVKLPKGAEIFAEGDPCTMIALVLKGIVRVYKLSESGREMTLTAFTRGKVVFYPSPVYSAKNHWGPLPWWKKTSRPTPFQQPPFLSG